MRLWWECLKAGITLTLFAFSEKQKEFFISFYVISAHKETPVTTATQCVWKFHFVLIQACQLPSSPAMPVNAELSV